MTTAPIALFGYNRADHLEQTVEYLKANDLADATDVYLFSDGPKNAAAEAGVAGVRRLAKGIGGFRSVNVIERSGNMGLRRSMIAGVSQVAEQYGRVIVVEDDIATCPGFLQFMNEALDFYDSFHTVGSISGYQAPYVTSKGNLAAEQTFFHYRTNCWGWATWWNRWGKADWEPQNWREMLASPAQRKLFGRGGTDFPEMFRMSMEGLNQSWMARWYYNCYLHGMLTLWPGRSLVRNIGFDGSGTHSKGDNTSRYAKYLTPLGDASQHGHCFVLPVVVDDAVHHLMKRFWDVPWFPETRLGQAIRPHYRRVKQLLKRKGATT